MRPSLVSCIIPVFNGERFLEASIDSVLGQTWKDLELIVVDDGSTDGTPGILKGYGDRIVAIRQDNAGPAAARNLGLARATGAFIAFNDADDLWVEDKLERQMAAFSADADLGFCVGHAQNFWEPELAHEAEQYDGHYRSRPIAAYVSTTLCVRRTVIDRVGRLDPTLGHGDSADWFLRAERLGIRGRLLPEVLLHRRLHRDNRSRQSAAASRDEFLAILKERLDRRRSLHQDGGGN